MRPLDSEMELRRFCNDVKEILGESPTIVELGSYMGESSVIFAQEFPKGKIICIDSWEGGFDNTDSCSRANYIDVESQFDFRLSLYDNIEKIKGFSTDYKIECDMVYIDACHKYECVVNDILHWRPFTKKIISGHDYNTEEFIKKHPHIAGVKLAVNEILNQPDKTYGDGSWYKISKMDHFYEKIDGFSNEENQLELLKTILPKIESQKITIVEIGVYKGRGTAMWNVHLINENKNYEYFAIDHFSGSSEHKKNIEYYEVTKNNLIPILSRINLIKNDSYNASSNFTENFFDIIYIDASHDYESVKNDLTIWLPKLKKGGVICGDDYILGWPGVIQAVDEIFGKEKINLVGTQQWWVKMNL